MSPRTFGLAAGLFVTALAIRLVHLGTVGEAPFFDLLILDSTMYDEWGRGLLSGDLRVGVFFQDPLYAYFLAVIYRVFGPAVQPVFLVQSVLGACIAPTLMIVTLRSLGRTTAVVAGVIAAIYLPAVYYDGLLLKTSLSMFFVAVTVRAVF